MKNKKRVKIGSNRAMKNMTVKRKRLNMLSQKESTKTKKLFKLSYMIGPSSLMDPL